MTFAKILRNIWATIGPRRRLIVYEGDTPPALILNRHLIVAREDGEDWAVALKCPCGCGERLELQLLQELRPSWRLAIDKKGLPTLHPSVWRKTGCKSHFWLRRGRISWCD